MAKDERVEKLLEGIDVEGLIRASVGKSLPAEAGELDESYVAEPKPFKQVSELVSKYAPDHFWFDSGTTPPQVDTRLEELVAGMRAQRIMDH